MTLRTRVEERARQVAATAFGTFVRVPSEKQWIQFQFYHWVLDDQRREFEKQLKFLRRYGDFIAIDDALTAMASGSALGGRYFCLTFDDGFRNLLTNVVPILKALEIPAAFFIPTRYIGLDLDRDWEQIAPFYRNSWSECDGVFEFLNWTDCAQMAAAGFVIGSHSHSHRRLTELSQSEARQEMSQSKEIIELYLSQACRHFCCPWGKAHRDYDPSVHPELARESGYESFLTADNGVMVAGDSVFRVRRNGCEPHFGPSALRYSLFAHSSRFIATAGEKAAMNGDRHIELKEPEPVQVEKFPYPYEAAFTVASDIDSASASRFRAVHALFCEGDLIEPGTPHWRTLGLSRECEPFNPNLGGVRGLGLDLADSFFLVGDRTTFGIYRHVPEQNRFEPDRGADGTDCAQLIRDQLKRGQMDSFHSFLHHTREQIAPLLREFYEWCEREAVAKPSVWINHSLAVTPTGLCPRHLQPHPMGRLLRVSGRNVIGPMIGFRRVPLRSALARYCGSAPESPHYINDLLATNGLRYVWLNLDDLHCNRAALPENELNGRESILWPVLMDDGTRYYRFERCFGRSRGRFGGESYLRDSQAGFDASSLISEPNLLMLCQSHGTSILYVHWTHPRSFPIPNETIARFELLRRWRNAGRIWVTSTSRLLEWTRRRTFLQVNCHREGQRLIVDVDGVRDPIFGHERVTVSDLDRLCLRVTKPSPQLTVAVHGQPLNPDQVNRSGEFCWVAARGTSDLPTCAKVCVP